MKRSEITPIPEYFDRYMNLCDDVTALEALQTAIAETNNFPLEKWEALGEKVYAPNKWTVKDILQHLIDTNRIFTYRALAGSRGEKAKLPSFEEDDYATAALANNRTLESLVTELRHTYESLYLLYESIPVSGMARACQGFKGEYGVITVPFIMAGHLRWHIHILEERYYSLL